MCHSGQVMVRVFHDLASCVARVENTPSSTRLILNPISHCSLSSCGVVAILYDLLITLSSIVAVSNIN